REQVRSGLSGELEYAADLYGREKMERFLLHYTRLLEAVAANVEIRPFHIDLLSEAEKKQQLLEFNPSEIKAQENRLPELFEAYVEKVHASVALDYRDEQVTYLELNRRANNLAHDLKSSGVLPEARVGICLERGVEMVIAALATFKAGSAYIPLDP